MSDQDQPDKTRGRQHSVGQTAHHIFRERLFSIPVLTVGMTALLGPWAVQSYSSREKREQMQVSVLNEMLSQVKAADFANANDVLRTSYLASIINENREAFGLTMAASQTDLRRLAEALKSSQINVLSSEIGQKQRDLSLRDAHIDVLSTEIIERSNELTKLQGAKKLDALAIERTKKEITRLHGEKDGLSAERGALVTSLEQLKEEYTQTSAKLLQSIAKSKELDENVKALNKVLEKEHTTADEHKKNAAQVAAQLKELKSKYDVALGVISEMDGLKTSLAAAQVARADAEKTAESLRLQLRESEKSRIEAETHCPVQQPAAQ